MPAAPPAPSSPSAPPPAAFRRIAVFCGSSAGTRPEFRQAAVALGVEMARRGIGLVYGGKGEGCGVGERGNWEKVALVFDRSPRPSLSTSKP